LRPLSFEEGATPPDHASVHQTTNIVKHSVSKSVAVVKPQSVLTATDENSEHIIKCGGQKCEGILSCDCKLNFIFSVLSGGSA